jgi:LmbE family N-acetylglucosaminyl deacetylase
LLKVGFANSDTSTFKLLCLGAHSDDIEIGCGGTILRLLEERKNVDVYWVVFGARGQRATEATESARLFLESAKEVNIIIKDFNDAFFPSVGKEIKCNFEELKETFSPDLIFTHFRHDLHQDHRLISDLTWNTFRDHLILEYEVVKYDGDLGRPNFFVHLNGKVCRRKIELIRNCFKTQGHKHWFTDDSFLSIMRIRGIESNAAEKYAEGFYCRKMFF